MELRQLRYFCAVASERNLTRAAERLGIRPTSLSQQIIGLERDIGVALFVRTPAGMEPTPAGQALLPKARALLDDAEQAIHVARDAADGDRRLRIGVTPGSPPAAVAGLSAAAGSRGFAAEPHDLPVARQLERLRSGSLDAGLIVLPADTSGLAGAVVSDVPLGVLVATGHPLAARPALDWPELAGQDLLWFDRTLAPGYHDHVLDACAAAGWRPRRVRVGPARRALFAAALGEGEIVALRPEWSAADGPLTWIPLSDPPRLRHALLWHKENPPAALPSIAAELADEAVAHERAAQPRGQAQPPRS